MVRGWSVVLGIGLVLLGLGGLGSNGGNWMSWLDFVAALGSFIVAGMVRPELAIKAGRLSGPALVAAGLFVMWVVAIATGSILPALYWWNFGFACAYALLAIAASGATAASLRNRRTSYDETDRQRPNRAA